MKILITGSEGFIGTHAKDYFSKKGYTVFGLDIKRGDDVTDREVVSRIFERVEPAIVIHLAWRESWRDSNQNIYSHFYTDLTGTLNILENCVRHKVERLIFMNSSQTYGCEKGAIIEGYPFKPLNGYARAKVCAVHMIQQFLQHKELPCTVFTSWEVYGEEAPPLTIINRLIKKALKDEPIPLYCKGKQIFDFNHIQNVCHAYDLAVQKGVNGIFNLGSGSVLNLEEAARFIVKLVGSKSKIELKPCRKGEKPVQNWPILDKINSQLYYQPPVNLLDGFRRVIKWRQHQE